MSASNLFHCPLNKYAIERFKLNPLEKFCYHFVFFLYFLFVQPNYLCTTQQIYTFTNRIVRIYIYFVIFISRYGINFFDFAFFPIHLIVRSLLHLDILAYLFYRHQPPTVQRPLSMRITVSVSSTRLNRSHSIFIDDTTTVYVGIFYTIHTHTHTNRTGKCRAQPSTNVRNIH